MRKDNIKYSVAKSISIDDLSELGYIANIRNMNMPLCINELGEFCAIKIFEEDNVAVEIDRITYDCKKYTDTINVYKYSGTKLSHIKLNDKVENELKYIQELLECDYVIKKESSQ